MAPLLPYIAFCGVVYAYMTCVVPTLTKQRYSKMETFLVNRETGKIMTLNGIADACGNLFYL